MSYCRWSSDDFGCDIYAYESVDGGYVIEVANNRHGDDVPKLDWSVLDTDPGAFTKQHNAQLSWLSEHPPTPIGLPYDGASYHEATLEDFRDRLMLLRSVGYRFPDEVFAEIEAETAAETTAAR